MSTDRPDDDDPTRALDDFVRRLQPAAAAPAAPDLSDLLSRLHPERTGNAPRPRGGTLRNGQTWDADDVEDVPVVELPRVQRARSDMPEVTLPPSAGAPPPDAAGVDEAVRGARDLAASRRQAEAAAGAAPGWQPDLQTLQLRRASHPRVLGAWQVGAWIGAVRQVFDSTTEFVRSADGNPTVETWPPHRLLLLWPPQRLDAPLLGRWPHRVRLSAVSRDEAPEALLAEVPGDAPLWLHDGGRDIDWALAAEIVLHHEPALRPFQVEGLRNFIGTEREASYAQLNAGYQPTAGGATARR